MKQRKMHDVDWCNKTDVFCYLKKRDDGLIHNK